MDRRVFYGVWIGIFLILQSAQAFGEPKFGLPWRAGQVWRVIRGYHASFRAPTGSSCCAIDFKYDSQDDTDEVIAVESGTAYAVTTDARQANCASNPIPTGFEWNGPFRWVEIDHGNGWRSYYAHLSRFADGLNSGVPVKVAKGEVIGFVGNSGCVFPLGEGDGSHLDFVLAHNNVAQPISLFEGRITTSADPARRDKAPVTSTGTSGFPGGEQYLSFNDGLVALAGDWNNDGFAEPGRYNGATATFMFLNATATTSLRCDQSFGNVGDLPVIGDWDGDGRDTVGVYRPSNATFYLSNATTCGNLGSADATISFGNANEIGVPVVGDWNGNLRDNVGLFRDEDPEDANRRARFHLGPDVGSSFAKTVAFGQKGDLPIAGNWDATLADEIGLFRPYVDRDGDGRSDTNTFYLDLSLSGGNAEEAFDFGIGGDRPIIGNWNGRGKDNVGIWRPDQRVFITSNDLPSDTSGGTTPPPPPPPTTCIYSLSPTAVQFKGQGGTGSIEVKTQQDCDWDVQYRPSWFEISGASQGKGSGTLSYRVAENPSYSASRGDTIKIAGQSFRVDQDNKVATTPPPSTSTTCSVSVTPSAKNFAGSGGSMDVSLSASPANCSWSASIPESWISVTPASGQGSQTVRISVTQNPSFTSSRGNVLTINNASFRVDQDNQTGQPPPPPAPTPSPPPPTTSNCATALSPTAKNFSGNGGSVTVNVSAPSTCTWGVSLPESWITSSASSGTGNGSVTISVAQNPSTAVSRGNNVTIGGLAFRVDQDNYIP